MAKHNMFRKELPTSPQKLPAHPIWRGIGCFLAGFLPIASYLLATMLIDNRDTYNWIIIPPEFLLKNNPQDPYFLIKIIYAILILIILAVLLTAITFFSSRLFGPSRYGPYDVPPEKVRKPRK